MIDSIKQHSADAESHRDQLEGYYRLHSRIYDLTRWSFLFGREELLDNLPELPPGPRILEVGCGTGKNLVHLEYLFPDGAICGIDLSCDMIERARSKLSGPGRQTELIEGAYGYGDESISSESFDLILFSYSLTMLGERVEQVLQQACSDLTPGGHIAVVDFDTSPFRWFRRWMKANHVDLGGHLPPLLQKFFTPVRRRQHSAYLGLWSYFSFIGRRK